MLCSKRGETIGKLYMYKEWKSGVNSSIYIVVDIILIQLQKIVAKTSLAFCFGGRARGWRCELPVFAAILSPSLSTLDDVVKSTKQCQAHGTLTISGSGNSSRP